MKAIWNGAVIAESDDTVVVEPDARAVLLTRAGSAAPPSASPAAFTGLRTAAPAR